MQTKEVLTALREKYRLTGETVPGPDTLKLISKTFDVSINTLLGAPRKLVCQCCGMPLYEDGVISREPEGDFNEDYCKWCYAGGKFVYRSLPELVDFLAPNMAKQYHLDEKTVRESLEKQLPQLKHWQKEA